MSGLPWASVESILTKTTVIFRVGRILLLDSIEQFIGCPLFGNPQIQIQVCSPGRLAGRRSALLAIGFYLGSDTLRRYCLGDFATSFTEHLHYPRGRRLVLYDAEG